VDNLTHLMATVSKIDEEARNKTTQYNDSKTQMANLSTKDGANLLARDLVDVLTPDVIKDGDYINTEHLTTVVVILPRGTEKEFLNVYESMSENIIPRSAMKFKDLDDKDGNSVWRVVMFKSCMEDFKKACREKRLAPRDFEYSEDAHKKLVSDREKVQDAATRQLSNVKGLYQAAWSDVMVAWVHIKAMRIFVESVLRFGMPPSFAAFTIETRGGAPARKALAQILGTKEVGSHNAEEGMGDDGEEHFPYVSFSFTPFTTPRT